MSDDHGSIDLGREVLELACALSRLSPMSVVDTLYASVFELARRTGQTPRTVLEVCFGDSPSDEEWKRLLLPVLTRALDAPA